MGAASSFGPSLVKKSCPKVTPWKELLEPELVRNKYIKDGSITEDCSEDKLELRALLDDVIAINYIKAYASSIRKGRILDCWNGLQMFADVNAATLQYSDENNKTYVAHIDSTRENIRKLSYLTKSCYSVFVSSIRTESIEHANVFVICRDDMVDILYAAKFDDYSEQMALILGKLRKTTLDCIHEQVYMEFKHSDQYVALCNKLDTSYNRVSTDDFFYIRSIGSGGFGLVLHCVKKSTGVNYAMKIQLKSSLIKQHKGKAAAIMVEMRTLSSCSHPYIASLAYAFQTPGLVILVMPLSTCGDLNAKLHSEPDGRLSLKHVQFYAAEITSALIYLHSNGLIYRDLKPSNVLVNDDGHIMLADFGSISDSAGVLDDNGNYSVNAKVPCIFQRINSVRATSMHRGRAPTQESTPTIAPWALLEEESNNGALETSVSCSVSCSANASTSTSCSASCSASGNASGNARGCHGKTCGLYRKRRVKSLVGTLSYMAPEIILKFSSSQEAESTDYTSAVDWFSLGVLIYQLLTGSMPFRDSIDYQQLSEMLPKVLHRTGGHVDEAFTCIFGSVYYFDGFFDKNTEDFVGGLLRLNPATRYGKNNKHKCGRGSELCSLTEDLSSGGASSKDGLSTSATGSTIGGLDDIYHFDEDEYSYLKSHGFFHGIDWQLVETKKVIPVDVAQPVGVYDTYVSSKIPLTPGTSDDGRLGMTHENRSTGGVAGLAPPKFTFENMLTLNRRKAWLDCNYEICNHEGADSLEDIPSISEITDSSNHHVNYVDAAGVGSVVGQQEGIAPTASDSDHIVVSDHVVDDANMYIHQMYLPYQQSAFNISNQHLHTSPSSGHLLFSSASGLSSSNIKSPVKSPVKPPTSSARVHHHRTHRPNFIAPRQQLLFRGWDYVSPGSILEELKSSGKQNPHSKPSIDEVLLEGSIKGMDVGSNNRIFGCFPTTCM